MTPEDTRTQPGPPPRAGYPPISVLRRSRTDRHVSGVAGGLGRYAGIDPLIIRILFVVLALFGGTGLLLYAIGWLLIPEEGQDESEGQRLFNGRSRSSMSTVLAIVVVIVIALFAVGAMFGTGPGIGGFAALVVIGVLVALFANRDRPAGGDWPAASTQTPPAYGPVPPPEPGAYGQTSGTAYAAAPVHGPPLPPPQTTTPMPPVPPTPPRERSVLGKLTFYVALIVVGLMVGWNAVSGNGFEVVAILATALAVVGVGLLVGGFVGRARGLIFLGVVLSIVTSAAAAASDGVRGGVGERQWIPTTASAAERPFRLGIGDAELDLTALPAGSSVDVDARLGVGELRITVPPEAEVVVDGDVGAGVIKLFDEDPVDGTDLHERFTSPGTAGSATHITIDAEVGLGELEVRR